MIDVLRRVEEKLVQAEGWLLVFLVSLMLVLAVYNVVYRNALVPLQAWMTVADSAPVAPVAPLKAMMVEEPEAKPAEDDEAAGFGGDFAAEPAADDEAAGFGGDFAAKPAADDEAAGFGGGFGGDFAGSTNEPAVPTPTPVPLEQAEPVELSATAQLVDAFVMAVKLEWIDVVLRHLVLVVGFLGAMLATQRRKHITIDALSKVLPQRLLPWTEALTSLLAAVICGFLASSGADLVAISREYPKELTAWADEWMFQLVFPVGFALLCFHFGVRVLESIGHGLQHAEQHVEQQGEV